MYTDLVAFQYVLYMLSVDITYAFDYIGRNEEVEDG
jgi:hypothetical protein